MALVTERDGNWTVYKGTDVEVLGALVAHNANSDKVSIVHDGTNVVAFVYGN